MSKLKSISDSDSNTSASWIFVDQCVPDDESEKNKYYLNCSSEPVQELTTPYLSSVEQETDSDGISVISESDDLKENSSTEEVTSTENVNDVLIENVTHHEKMLEIDDECVFSKYVIFGWLLLAVATPLVLNYSSTYMDGVLKGYRANTAVDFSKPELLTDEKELNVLKNGKLDGEKELDANKICDQQVNNKNRNILDAKKKYESKGEIDIHRFNCKDNELICEQSPGNNAKKEEKNNKKMVEGEGSLKEDVLSPTPKDIKNGNLQEIESMKQQEQMYVSKNDMNLKKKKNKKKNHKNKEIDLKSNDVPKKKKKNDEVEKPKLDKKKKNDEVEKPKLDKKKNDEVEKPKLDRKKKVKKAITLININNENSYYKEIKSLKKLLQARDRDVKELTRLVKMKNKQLKVLEHKILKELNTLRNSNKNENQVQKDVETEHSLKEKVNNTSAEWYYRLFKGRTKFRSKQHSADWVFDRADFRSRKRDFRKNWYWNWMSNREQLRYKRSYWLPTY